MPSASRIAIGRLNLIITGEPGVGKGRFGERIHEMSPRRAAPFARVNCAAISESLLEAELFGTDMPNRSGVLENTDGGTLFLNDVDQLTDAHADVARGAEDEIVGDHPAPGLGDLLPCLGEFVVHRATAGSGAASGTTTPASAGQCTSMR